MNKTKQKATRRSTKELIVKSFEILSRRLERLETKTDFLRNELQSMADLSQSIRESDEIIESISNIETKLNFLIMQRNPKFK
jgi:hypothetical protein